MPRISIIIAHQHDQRLEDTLVSILENRPADSEIIVAHDGSYDDPYHLADEVLFVETDEKCSLASKLNEALYAACAPVVHILGEGVQVSDGWCENAISWISRHGCVAVAPLVETTGLRTAVYAGLDEARLSKRGLKQLKRDQSVEFCAGPILQAGFYSRKLLLGLGGLLESVDSRVSDVDLALTLADLGGGCEVDVHSSVTIAAPLIEPTAPAGLAGDLASVLAAHHQLDSGLVPGIKGVVGRLLANAVNPSQWAAAIAWGAGLASNRLEQEVEMRLAAYRRSQVNEHQGSLQLRRAA